MIHSLLDQIDSSSSGGNFFVALIASLAVPDICGAMESPNGKASPAAYMSWFDSWVSSAYITNGTPLIDGTTCYYYRCAALHQARAQHPKLGYSRIIFIEPGHGLVMHRNVLNDVLNIDVRIFCSDITHGARQWLDQRGLHSLVRKNLSESMQRYPNGLPPFIVGIPVIG
jgi:hypothetical protein